MNKVVKIFICVSLILCCLLSVVSCDSSNTDTSTDSASSESNTTQSNDTTSEPSDDTTSEPSDDTTSEPSDETTSEPSDDTNPEEETQPTEALALANPNTVLLDSKGVKLTALDFSTQSSESYITIDVQIENNNTHDVNIMINSLTVNGYVISGSLASLTTKAGTSQIVPLQLSKRDIDFAEIEDIREISISLYAKDENFKLFISPTEPVSLKTTKFDTPAKELDVSGVQVYNDNHILIVVKEELSSDSRYMFAKLLIQNSADFGITVGCSKLLVNGQEITNFNCIRYGKVSAGVISYNSMDIEKSELEGLGIQDIETLEITFKVITSDYTLLADNLTVTVHYK